MCDDDDNNFFIQFLEGHVAHISIKYYYLHAYLCVCVLYSSNKKMVSNEEFTYISLFNRNVDPGAKFSEHNHHHASYILEKKKTNQQCLV